MGLDGSPGDNFLLPNPLPAPAPSHKVPLRALQRLSSPIPQRLSLRLGYPAALPQGTLVFSLVTHPSPSPPGRGIPLFRGLDWRKEAEGWD